jgi:predicted choloylglycine hydrolase
MKKLPVLILIIHLLAFPALNLNCKEGAGNPSGENNQGNLEKISDFPVYFLKYKGDYHFSEYLNSGKWPNITYYNGNWGCTCFSTGKTENGVIFSRNFDWHNTIPLLLFTQPPDGYASISMVSLEYFGYNKNHLPDTNNNFSGLSNTPYLPFDGMNEKGVAIGMMAIPSAEPPKNSSKVSIGEIEVIRLVLDRAASTNEAIELIKNYNVKMTNPPIHYMITDSSGVSAILEFVAGEMIIIKNTEKFLVSTNFIIHGTNAPLDVSCSRYNTVYNSLKKTNGNISMDDSRKMLEQVSQENTIWSTIYNTKTGDIQLFINRDFNKIKRYNLKELMNGNGI